MGINYTLQIEYSPAYELVASFYTYVYADRLKLPMLGKSWRDEVRAQLPSAYARELDDERWEVLHRVVLLISQCPQKATVESCLEWLARLPAGEIYERLVPWVNAIPLHLGELRDRAVDLLAQWHEHYFRHFDPRLLQRLQTDAQTKQALSGEVAPIDLIETATNGIRIEPTPSLQKVILIPQYHCAPAAILDFFGGAATCLYPLPTVPGAADGSPLRLLELAQAIGDEKRLQILMTLRQGPQTLTQLQEAVKLAKSTVHHHITTLRRAGVVRSHFLDSSFPAYYSLREQFVSLLTQELQLFLTAKEQHHARNH